MERADPTLGQSGSVLRYLSVSFLNSVNTSKLEFLMKLGSAFQHLGPVTWKDASLSFPSLDLVPTGTNNFRPHLDCLSDAVTRPQFGTYPFRIFQI